MFVEGLELTLTGMSGVFLFLLLLIASMYAQAAIFQYLGISDETEKTTGGDEALVAAAIAVKLKNG
ncbi:MAG: hypothetical protein IJY17_06820 [Alphaproteobacteria bacterium]|nr:hypothetical protein [Alphaproteobacteria bacterium]